MGFGMALQRGVWYGSATWGLIRLCNVRFGKVRQLVLVKALQLVTGKALQLVIGKALQLVFGMALQRGVW